MNTQYLMRIIIFQIHAKTISILHKDSKFTVTLLSELIKIYVIKKLQSHNTKYSDFNHPFEAPLNNAVLRNIPGLYF